MTDSGIECKFAVDTKISGAVDTFEGKDLETFEEWAHVNFKKLSKA